MIIDISQPLTAGMAGFPGDAGYEESRTFVIGPGCPVNVARIAMSTHCGSHADAPSHYDAAGTAIRRIQARVGAGPGALSVAASTGNVSLSTRKTP